MVGMTGLENILLVMLKSLVLLIFLALMSNFHLKDKKLSLEARGSLSLMLSLHDNCDYSLSGLVNICNAGIKK